MDLVSYRSESTDSLRNRLVTGKFHLEEVSGPVLVADIGKGLERRQERGMLSHLRISGHILTEHSLLRYGTIYNVKKVTHFPGDGDGKTDNLFLQ